MCLGLTAVASLLWLAFEVDQARARIAGEAGAIVETLAGEAFALHHWLHEARNGIVNRPAEGTARVLSAPEETALEGHAAWAPYLALPPGWTLTRLIALPAAQDNTPALHGIVVLRPNGSALLREEVLGRVIAEAGGDGALDLAAPGTTVDATTDIAAMAWVFGGIDTRAVLRAPRAGHGVPQMLVDLDLGGNDIVDNLNTGRIGTDAGEVSRLSHPEGREITLVGELDARELRGTGTATQIEIASGLNVRGEATFAGIRAEQGMSATDLTVTGRLLATDRLSAERNLDMVGGRGPLAWDSMVVFGLGSFDRTGATGDMDADVTIISTVSGTPTPPHLTVTNGCTPNTCRGLQ